MLQTRILAALVRLLHGIDRATRAEGEKVKPGCRALPRQPIPKGVRFLGEALTPDGLALGQHLDGLAVLDALGIGTKVGALQTQAKAGRMVGVEKKRGNASA